MMTIEADLERAFAQHRKQHENGWGLAWYIAAELCERFYASHGIVPQVICREGIGYYGIALVTVPCRVHGRKQERLGRLTAKGDVENWLTGSPGDHGLSLSKRLEEGEQVEGMVGEAIRHLGFHHHPDWPHPDCRHKRWGDSYRLVFRIAALVALQHRGFEGGFNVWNAPEQTDGVAKRKDPEADMKEHPGHFMITHGGKRAFISGDGRVLDPAGEASIWERYMAGESVADLVGWLEGVLGI